LSAAIVWFREDLRLADNPALTAAVETGAPVLPVFVDDPNVPCGAASAVWQRQALISLAQDLAAIGLPLVWFRGAPETVCPP
jgi:Deoxyribodipyrimidine photolyase